MNLPEFITYCTLKNLIVSHDRLDNEYIADKVNKQKLVIENDNFLAQITYTHFAGKYSVFDSSITEVMPTFDKDTFHADLDTIIGIFA